MRVRHLDLFSGMGGFALAVQMLGHQTIGFCDNDKASQELLALRWPGVPIHDDIRALTGPIVDSWGGCDLITGGFPCQPFSVAGNQRGADDDRHLWPEMVRVIDECRPRYVLGENVTGIIKMELDTVISDLESIGYTARAIVVPAIGTDAPHRRERVWILAHDDRQPAQQPIRGRGGTDKTVSGVSGQDVSHADSTGQREQRRPEPGGEFLAASEQHCVWPAEPGMGRVAARLPRRVDRLRLLGNGIVPAVAVEILRPMIGDAS